MKKIFVVLSFLACSVAVQAQDYVKPISGEPFYADIKNQMGDSIKYESSDLMFSIAKKDIVLVEYLELGLRFYNKEQIKPLDVSNYNGLLYAKGNNIYIPFASKKVKQRIGAMTFRNVLKSDGYWNVVDCPEEAHCIMEYVFSEQGQDHAYFQIKDRNGKVLYKSPKAKLSGMSIGNMVPSRAAVNSVDQLYKRSIPKLKKSIEKGVK